MRSQRSLSCGAALRKGKEMGWFQHGSTIIVLAPKGFRLCNGVHNGATIRVGQPLMRLPSRDHSLPGGQNRCGKRPTRSAPPDCESG